MVTQKPNCYSFVNSRGSRHQICCHCNEVAPLRVVRSKGPHLGRNCYGYINYPEHCGFMKCEDEVSDIEDMQLKILERDIIVSELQFEKEELQQIVKKLKGRKEIVVEDEMKEFKFEVSQLRNEMSTYMKALFLCMVGVAVVLMLK